MIPNPSADNHYCHQYFKQRQINPKLVHSKPHKVTRLVLHNGTKVLCWEEGLEETKNMSLSTSGRYGWCKVLLVRTLFILRRIIYIMLEKLLDCQCRITLIFIIQQIPGSTTQDNFNDAGYCHEGYGVFILVINDQIHPILFSHYT